jgi:hypothetical protein
MYPYNEAELEAFYRRAADRNQRLADWYSLTDWLRWSECIAWASNAERRAACLTDC